MDPNTGIVQLQNGGIQMAGFLNGHWIGRMSKTSKFQSAIQMIVNQKVDSLSSDLNEYKL